MNIRRLSTAELTALVDTLNDSTEEWETANDELSQREYAGTMYDPYPCDHDAPGIGW